MTHTYFLLQRTYFLSSLLFSIAEHILPPILVFLLRESSLDSFLKRIFVNILKVKFWWFAAYNSMELWALLKLLWLSFSSKLWHSNIISMHVRIGYFSNELIILIEEMMDLLMDRRKVFEVKPLGWSLFSWRFAIFVIGVILFDRIRNGNFLKISNWKIEILNEETGKVFLLQRVYPSIVIIKHLIGNSFNCRVWTLYFILNVSCMVILGLFHFSLIVITTSHDVVNHQLCFCVFRFPCILEIFLQNYYRLIPHTYTHGDKSQSHQRLSLYLGDIRIRSCHSRLIIKVKCPVFILNLVTNVCS